jgi:hypothetical protein
VTIAAIVVWIRYLPYAWYLNNDVPAVTTESFKGTIRFTHMQAFDPPADGVAYSSCGPDGSKYPVGKAPSNAGPNQPPDCGVLWNKATTGTQVTATVTFDVTWTGGGQGGTLNPITITSNPANVSVAEIQNLNG